MVIWNFSGWENLSVVSAEIENPRRNYLRAILIALPIIVAGYVLPLAVSVSGAITAADWGTGSFSRVGYAVGGPALGGALALGGAVMSFAVFEAAMLWVSRMPFVLARERYLSPPLAELWSTTATPGKSILLCCVVFTLLVPVGFVALVVLDVFFYMAALALELLALLRLRKRMPDRAGMFTIGGGRVGLALVAILPILTWAATFGLADLGRRGQGRLHPGDRAWRMRLARVCDLPAALRRPARYRSSAHQHYCVARLLCAPSADTKRLTCFARPARW